MNSDSPLYPPQPILVVDDDAGGIQSLQIAMKTGGLNHHVTFTDSVAAAASLSRRPYEAILLDLNMPRMSGEQVLEVVMREQPDTPVIVVTATDELEIAVRCVRAGAFDYMVKPVARERLLASVRRAVEMRALRRENEQLREHVLSKTLRHPEAFTAFNTADEKLLAMFGYAESIAESSDPVLITGETGVGKEVMARGIHDLSGRKGEYVAVNVAGLDDNTFSDTLFGHRKGAFTGATEARRGLVEKAAGGSLFLDEIGELGMNLQVKLLRLLQEREFMPLGSDTACKTDARIIVATNVPIETLRTSDRFRRDLYFRLCHHHVHLPALRERADDLPLLIADLAERSGRGRAALPENLAECLKGYDFPGNVRELNAMLNDALSSHPSGRVPRAFFEQWIRRHGGKPGEARVPEVASAGEGLADDAVAPLPTLKGAQEQLIEAAMRRADGNQAVAARILGITRQALNRRLAGKKK